MTAQNPLFNGKSIVAVFRAGRAFTRNWLTEARRDFSRSPACLTINYFLPQFVSPAPYFQRVPIPLSH
jgi:hypothetical protein